MEIFLRTVSLDFLRFVENWLNDNELILNTGIFKLAEAFYRTNAKKRWRGNFCSKSIFWSVESYQVSRDEINFECYAIKCTSIN